MQTTKKLALPIEGGKEGILKVKPKGGECRNKLRKHLVFIYFKIEAVIYHFFGACFDFAPLWCRLKPRAGAQIAPRFQEKEQIT